MAQVRQAMGPDAIIVSTFEAKRGRGVEVTAAIEDDVVPSLRPPAFAKAAPGMPAAGAAKTGRPSKPVEPDWALERDAPIVPDSDWVPLRSTLRRAPAEAVVNPAPRQASGPPRRQAQPAAVRSPSSGAAEARAMPSADRDRIIAQALEYHAVPRPIADALFNAARAIEDDDPAMALAGALESRIAFAPLAPVPRRPTMLIGPVGAGKTVTVAKIAAKAVLSGATIDVITTDTLRAGAIAQIETYTNVLEQELGIEETPDGLGQRLLDVEPGRAVIIDTPGANPYTTSEMADLALFISSGPDIDPILVMAAGGDAREMGEAATAFRRLGVKRLIVTRLDAARRLGGLIGAADAGLTLAQVSMSPYVADALVTINPVSLSRLLLNRAEAKNAEMEAVSA